MASQSLPERILAICDALATRPGASISLVDLRNQFSSVDRDELDRTLIEMDDDRLIQMEPDPDRRGLTPEAHAAAVNLAGRPMHLLRAIGARD